MKRAISSFENNKHFSFLKMSYKFYKKYNKFKFKLIYTGYIILNPKYIYKHFYKHFYKIYKIYFFQIYFYKFIYFKIDYTRKLMVVVFSNRCL